MKIGEALKIITDEGDTHYVDPFCLYSRLTDLVGSDYKERDKLRLMFRIDKRLSLVGRLTEGGIDEVERIKGEAETIGDLCDEATFCDIVDTVASALIEGYALPELIESTSDEPTEPDGSNEFDYGYVEERPSVADCLGDKNGLMQFTKAQLKQYCFEQGFRGYGSLKKEDLVKFIMNGGKLKHSPAKNAPTIANNATTNSPPTNRVRVSRLILCILLGAAVIAGLVCLIIFARRMQWYQWQHIIGSVGGLIVCGGCFLIALALGCLMEDVIGVDFDGYFMTILIMVALLIITNSVLAFVLGEIYTIIFYWLSGYGILASLIMIYACFTENEAGEGIFGIINVIVAAAIICFVIFAEQIQWYQWQHIIGSMGGLILCGIGGLFVWGLGYLFDNVIITDFDGYFMAVPIVLAVFVVANSVLSFVFGSVYIIIFYWLSGYCLLISVFSIFAAFGDDETAAGIFSTVDAVVVAVMVVTQVLIQVL